MTQNVERTTERAGGFLIGMLAVWGIVAAVLLRPTYEGLAGWGESAGLRTAALVSAGVLVGWAWLRVRVAGK